MNTLPKLRQDLVLIQTEAQYPGASTWVLNDKVRNRFFRLQWLEIEILKLLKNEDTVFKTVDDIKIHLENEISTQIDELLIPNFFEFLEQQGLVEIVGAEARQKSLSKMISKKKWYTVFLRHYLFFKIPLINPDGLLDTLAPRLRWLFNVKTVWALGFLSLLGILLTARHWQEFNPAIAGLLTPQGVLGFLLVLGIVKILHEFGHALAAKSMGCSVSRMGIAFMVFWPVLYTDTTDAWRLPHRHQRLWIGVAGILIELIVAIICLLLWHILPAGNLKSICYLLATVTWAMTLLINLNPLLRFDGYFVFSDLWGVENLQERSFALGRWWLRKNLFGLYEPAPESPKKSFIVYCYCAWIYRFFLVTIIATLIYTQFFKLLAVVLLTVYLISSVLQPIVKEIIYCLKNREKIIRKTAYFKPICIFTMIMIFLCLPWSKTIYAPAILQVTEAIPIYTHADGKILKLPKYDQKVLLNELILSVDAPDLDYEKSLVRNEYLGLKWRLDNHSVADGRLPSLNRIQQELASVIQKQGALEAMYAKTQVYAPHQGTVVDVPNHLNEGSWVAKGTRIGTLIVEKNPQVLAYVDERSVHLIAPNLSATFIADGGSTRSVKGYIESIDQTALPSLEKPYVASIHGGEVPTTQLPSLRTLEVVGSYYRVRVSTAVKTSPERVLRGMVRLEARAESIISKINNRVVGLWRREAGF